MGGDFLHALANQLRAQPDPVAPAQTPAATPLLPTLPAGGNASPQLPAIDPETLVLESTPEILVAGAPMPLPVQPPLAAADAIDAGAVPPEVVIDASARDALPVAERSTPRTLLALLGQRAGTQGADAQADAPASAAAQTGSGQKPFDLQSMVSSAATPAAQPSLSARESAPVSAHTVAHASAEAAPPSATVTPLAVVPNEAVRTQPPAFHIEQPVGQAAWRDAVGQQVTWMVEHQVSRAELRLHPAHLGPIDVSVSVNDNEVSVSFHASHPATREALESSLPRLRELLGDTGLSLGNASVSQQFAGNQRAPERLAEEGSGPRDVKENAPAQRDAVIASRLRLGLLDTYA
jgi:flagellar hook-length control protein FliK